MCTEVSAYVSLYTKICIHMRPYTGYDMHVCVAACSIVGIWCLDAHTVHMVHCLKSYTPLMLVHMYIHKCPCGNSYKAHHTEVHTRAMLCTTQFEMWGNAIRMYTLTLAVTWRVVQ